MGPGGLDMLGMLGMGSAGLAVPPEDVDAFADALAELLADPAARAEMGERGRRFVETWVSPTGVAAAYGQLFADLTN